MKRLLLLLLTAIAVQLSAYSQNTFPSSGNVGIGTTTPLKTLHVNGFGAFGNRVTSLNATRALNLADVDAVMRILRVHASYAPAVELISRTSADGANVAYWDFYAEPSDKSFRIRDRTGGGHGLDRVTVSSAGNIGIGTTAPSQKLHVVGNATFTGDLYLNQKLFLQSGLFLHSRGMKNTFIGDSVGTSVIVDDPYGQGRYNTGVGDRALYSLTLGYHNTASGASALQNNTSGYYNTASGASALYANTTGSYNNASGVFALRSNTTGNYNNAIGGWSLYYNTTGFSNTAIGLSSLQSNTSGGGNTAIGVYSLFNNLTGYYNTALGNNAGVSSGQGNLSNVTAIGFNAIVDASNKVRIGNTSVTSIGGSVNWTAFSDGRYKRNIQEDVQGLSFINSLRPITYTVDVQRLNAYYNKGHKQPDNEQRRAADEKAEAFMKEANEKAGKIVYSGFVAQEVEETAKKLKYEFSGVDKPEKGDGLYGLRYSDFVVPLVKAVQELSKENEVLKKKTEEIEELKQRNDNLEARLQKLEALLTRNNNATSVNVSSAYLEQSAPNPSRSATTIRYHVPENSTSAQLVLTNAKGQAVKTYSLSSRGSGQLTINTDAIAAGNYNYTLYVDGKSLDTKKLLVLK